MEKRIDYLDGLKGFASMLVVMAHVGVIAFYDSYTLFGSSSFGNRTAAVQTIMGHPLTGILTNSCAGFFLFFVMIPLFPILKYRRTGSPAVLGNYALKRYFQLLAFCLPVAFAGVLLYWNGLYHAGELAARTGCAWLTASFTPSGCATFPDFLKTVFYSMWLDTSHVPVTTMWCMHNILGGSLGVYAAYALLGSSPCRYLPGLVLLALSLPFPILAPFAVGSLLAEHSFVENANGGMPPALLFVAGLILMKLPMALYPIPLGIDYPSYAGAGLLIWAVHDSRVLQRFFSAHWLTFLGRISFEMILVHCLFLGSIGCTAYGWLLDCGITSPLLLFAFELAVLAVPSLAAAWLLHYLVSSPVTRLLKKDFLGGRGKASKAGLQDRGA